MTHTHAPAPNDDCRCDANCVACGHSNATAAEREGEHASIAWLRHYASPEHWNNAPDYQIFGSLYLSDLRNALAAFDAALLAARRERDASDVLLDAAERGEWAISPQVGGGWVVEQTFPIDISGDASPREIARTRGTLREALRAALAALAATPEGP